MAVINFTKMQGLGNDFVILDYEEYEKTGKEPSELAKELCDRHFGIGADGLIVVKPVLSDYADIGWIFYNSDGTMAQMCGNGIRCFAKYVYKKGYVNKKKFSVETKAGIIVPEILDNGLVRVDMDKPILAPERIPVKAENNLDVEINLPPIGEGWGEGIRGEGKCGQIQFHASAISMGNPHCVIITEGDTKELALRYGREIEVNEIFPEKTNVEFIKIKSRDEIELDVWERGCRITLACGTGACASVVAGILKGLLDNKVKVNLPGGTLLIEWQGSKTDPNHSVFMSGAAELSFLGEITV